MTDNTELFEDALEAINNLFDDRTVSQGTCKDNMQSLISEIQMLVGSLDE